MCRRLGVKEDLELGGTTRQSVGRSRTHTGSHYVQLKQMSIFPVRGCEFMVAMNALFLLCSSVYKTNYSVQCALTSGTNSTIYACVQYSSD